MSAESNVAAVREVTAATAFTIMTAVARRTTVSGLGFAG
jgi:hypothetical protein